MVVRRISEALLLCSATSMRVACQLRHSLKLVQGNYRLLFSMTCCPSPLRSRLDKWSHSCDVRLSGWWTKERSGVKFRFLQLGVFGQEAHRAENRTSTSCQ